MPCCHSLHLALQFVYSILQLLLFNLCLSQFIEAPVGLMSVLLDAFAVCFLIGKLALQPVVYCDELSLSFLQLYFLFRGSAVLSRACLGPVKKTI